MLQTFNEKNRNLIVNINGRLMHRNEAGVSPFDSIVQGGDAVWEGLRLYNGRIFRLNEHLDRLRSSALALAFAQIPSHEEIRQVTLRMHESPPAGVTLTIRLPLAGSGNITRGRSPLMYNAGPLLVGGLKHKEPVKCSKAPRPTTRRDRTISALPSAL